MSLAIASRRHTLLWRRPMTLQGQRHRVTKTVVSTGLDSFALGFPLHSTELLLLLLSHQVGFLFALVVQARLMWFLMMAVLFYCTPIHGLCCFFPWARLCIICLIVICNDSCHNNSEMVLRKCFRVVNTPKHPLSYWGKMAAIWQSTFSNSLLCGNCCILIQISLRFVPKGPINNWPTLSPIMARHQTGHKPLSEPVVD